MSALPRPDLPPGPHRDLVTALHDLHHRAGWPSLRTLARDTGVSHTTVSKALSSSALPPWGTLELLVETMHGDTARFHDLWLAASTPSGRARPTPRIAGRRTELEVVRRHLETGTGLLLVTGEAGIGKTTLVEAATEVADVFVAAGRCLPLSAEVPLLPLAAALGAIHAVDEGRWLAESLTDVPPYVAGVMARLLPELETGAAPHFDEASSLLHVFSATTMVLARLAARRPLALLFEDLHWADLPTLDLVEHLSTRSPAPRVVGTWRSEDPDTTAQKSDWLARTGRTGVVTVELGPLSLEDTTEQLRLVTGTPPEHARARRIHSRSAGHPLFTEHLATVAGAGDLPRVLVDLLDRRLGELSGPRWTVARALGIADRALDDITLTRATGLSGDDVVSALHDLNRQRLVGAADGHVQLAHPLLAEAVRRRAMPGESVDVHRRLAAAMAVSQDASASEVALHWQASGDRSEELTWRLTAAREAARRFGPAEEADHWLRALELWPPDGTPQGPDSLGEITVAFHAADALVLSGQVERSDMLVASLMPRLDTLAPRDAAELLATAANCEADLRSKQSALSLMDRALAVLEPEGPSVDLVMLLRMQADLLVDLGRLAEASTVHDRALEVNRTVGDVLQERILMAERAWHLLEEGRRRQAVETAAAALRIQPPTPDPFVEVGLWKHYADLLLETDASSHEVVAAAQRGLHIAEECGFDTWYVAWLRYDLVIALARSGAVAAAGEVVDPLTSGGTRLVQHPLDLARADVDLRRGRLDEVRERAAQWQDDASTSIDVRSRRAGLRAELALWAGERQRALDLLEELVGGLVDLEEVVYSGVYFALTARATADVALSGTADRRRSLSERLRELRARAVRDPLSHTPAYEAMWEAELARIDGTEELERWSRAAGAWNSLDRPHDAAYCRWRAAQAALRDGHATVAARLLKRAATEAREHVPLLQAIAATRSSA